MIFFSLQMSCVYIYTNSNHKHLTVFLKYSLQDILMTEVKYKNNQWNIYHNTYYDYILKPGL